MRAGVFRGIRQVPIEDVPDPSPGPRDVVLDVKACGICGSDLHTYVAAQLAATGVAWSVSRKSLYAARASRPTT